MNDVVGSEVVRMRKLEIAQLQDDKMKKCRRRGRYHLARKQKYTRLTGLETRSLNNFAGNSE